VSHQPLRTETNCLNCGTDVAGRYCQNCGQENIVTRQNAWSLITHFVYDIFHFDGKFFDTLRYLFFRPGRVPREYAEGRRQKYLDPIRMYLFTSALFFLIFFAISKFNFKNNDVGNAPLSAVHRYELATTVRQSKDSFSRYVFREVLDTTKVIYLEDNLKNRSPDSLLTFQGKRYAFISDKDSFQFLQGDWLKGNGWLQRFARGRVERIREKVSSGEQTPQALIFTDALHRLPYLLFVSLPFFALLLKLLYLRRSEKYFYSDHLIFTLYHYIFSFILLLLVIFSTKAKNYTGFGIFNWIIFALLAYGLIYLYKGMRNFYGQSRGKTLVKFMLLNVLAFFMSALLFLIFLLISAIQIH
jgi:hypothetical protein